MKEIEYSKMTRTVPFKELLERAKKENMDKKLNTMIYKKEITTEHLINTYPQQYNTITKHYVFGIHIFTTGIKTIG